MDLLIYIDLPKAMAAGVKFFISTNNVVLTRGVDESGVLPSVFFERAMKRLRDGVEEELRIPVPAAAAAAAAVADVVRAEIDREIEQIQRDPKSRNPNGSLYARVVALQAERAALVTAGVGAGVDVTAGAGAGAGVDVTAAAGAGAGVDETAGSRRSQGKKKGKRKGKKKGMEDFGDSFEGFSSGDV